VRKLDERYPREDANNNANVTQSLGRIRALVLAKLGDPDCAIDHEFAMKQRTPKAGDWLI
jgi:hypothetical protein